MVVEEGGCGGSRLRKGLVGVRVWWPGVPGSELVVWLMEVVVADTAEVAVLVE